MLFLVDEFAGELKGSTDVGDGQAVFLPDLVEGHAACEAAHDKRDGHSRATNYWFAMANLWVNDNAFVHIFQCLKFTRHVNIKQLRSRDHLPGFAQQRRWMGQHL